MKYAMITDLHYGTRGGSIHFQEAMDSFISNNVLPTLLENNIDTLYVLGDFTDSRKSTNYRIVQQVRKNFFDLMAEHGITVYIICGNHDIFYKEKNEIASFDVLFGHYDIVIPIIEPKQVGDVLILPWINKNNQDQVLTAIKNTKAKYCMGHFEINGAKMYKHSRAEHGMDADVLRKFDKVFSGHFHHRSQYGNIHYIGAAGYYTWQDFDDFRGMTIFDSETGQQEVIENPYCLFDRILYNEDESIDYNHVDLSDYEGKYVEVVVTSKEKPVIYKDFIKRLYQISTLDVKIDDRTVMERQDTKTSDGMVVSQSKPIIELVYDYAETNTDRPEPIKKLVKEVHDMAVNQ